MRLYALEALRLLFIFAGVLFSNLKYLAVVFGLELVDYLLVLILLFDC